MTDIKDLPITIRELALMQQVKQGNKEDANIVLNAGPHDNGFRWADTLQSSWWNRVDNVIDNSKYKELWNELTLEQQEGLIWEDNESTTKVYTKDDFIVGKWYKGNNYIIKVEKSENKSTGVHIISEYFGCEPTFKVDNSSGRFNSKMLEGSKEISIEEVQQYLPKDHPDIIKPIELPIIGEVYRVDENGFWMIGKIFTSKDSKESTKEEYRGKATYITSGKDIIINSLWCYKDFKETSKRDYKLATPEEKAWLEECIKQGKYVDQDKVPNVVTEEELFEEAKKRYPIGTKFKVVHRPNLIRTVKSHDKHPSTFIYNKEQLHVNFIVNKEDNTLASVYCDGKWAEIVTLEAKFKVSDSVNVNDKGYQFCNPEYEWKRIINTNIKTPILKGAIIIEVVHSKLNNKFWYKVNNSSNYFSEDSIEAIQIVKKPPKQTQFLKDEYIIILTGNSESFIKNNIYKIRENNNYLRPYLDSSGSNTNGWNTILYGSDTWRYATKEEIDEYDKLGKPYDITTLNIKLNKELGFTIGDWVKLSNENYRKIESIDVKKNRISYLEYILKGKYIIQEQSTTCISLERMTKVSLSEINQYLPKEEFKAQNKPTKAIEITSQYWIKQYCEYTYLNKYTLANNTGIGTLEYYISFQTNTFEIGSESTRVDSIKLPTQDQIDWLEECIKLNKYISFEEFKIPKAKWIPKVGDWIVITKSKINWAPGMDKFIDKSVQIIRVKDNNRICFENDLGWTWDYSQGHFRQALPHEIPTLVGQMIPLQREYNKVSSQIEGLLQSELSKHIKEVKNKSKLEFLTLPTISQTNQYQTITLKTRKNVKH